MSDEYIRKQDAVDVFNRAVQDVGILDADDIEAVFGMLSSADVAPVVHGKWIPQDHNKRIGCAMTAVFYYPKCSACGHSGNYDMHFCPNCGAKMDKE